MIVSASYRTDIPAFYAAWFRERFRAGEAVVANPYGGLPARVPLREGCDGFVFWTRNAEPFRAALDEVAGAGLPFVVQYSLTGYPRPLETSVPPAARAVESMRRISGEHGAAALVWRYDPIVLSDLTPPEWHLARFETLAAGLEGATEEVVTSFVQPYAKTRRRLGAAARAGGFAWRDPEAVEKRDLLRRLAAIAAARGMALTVCAQPDLADTGFAAAACVDAARLSRVAGRRIAAAPKGNRPGCACAESRDIGAYDSCAHGCVYCYAVGSAQAARRRLRAHDPAAERLA